MFGLVHAVLLTLITFGLVSWFPGFSHWSFSFLGCILLPVLSLAIGIGCAWCVAMVTEDVADWLTAFKRGWMPAVGVFCSTLFLLPLEMMQSDGPLTMLVAASVIVNGIVAWILQVYGLRHSSSVSDPGASGPI